MDEPINKQLPFRPAPAPSPDLPPVRPTVPLPKSVRQRVPKKIRDAIDLIAFGHVDTKAAAARKIGISREYLARSYQNPAVIQYSNEAAARAVAMGRPRAAAVLNELHDSRSERVRLEAAKASLGAIVAPANSPQVNVNLEMRAGWVIDLSGRDPGDRPPVKVVEGAAGAVIDAKPVE
jgi:hypothetical protein